MTSQKIINLAKDRLPCVNECPIPFIAIPVCKELPLIEIKKFLPKERSVYEVRFVKRTDKNNNWIWRSIGVY